MSLIATTAHRGFSLSLWIERHARGCYVAAFLGLQAVVQFPIWYSTLPALSDYPNHLARMHILLNAGRVAELNRFYEIHWAVLPNLAMDLLVPLLASVFGLELAGKLFLALILLLISSGTLALHYVLHRRLSPWPFMVFFFLYNLTFIQGVVNFLFGVGVALWAITAWLATRFTSAAWRLPAFSLLALLLFFCHLSAFCVYALVIAVYEVRYALCHHKEPFLRSAPAIAAITLALPAVIFLMFSPTGGAGQGFNWHGLTLPQYIVAMFGAKLFAPLVLARNYNLWLDYLTFIAVGILLIRGVFSGGLVVERTMTWPLTAIGIAFLLTPPVLYGSAMADYRLVTALSFVFIGSTDLTPKVSPRWRVLVLGILASLFMIRMSVIVDSWTEEDRLAGAYVRAFDQLPAGKRVFTAFPGEMYTEELGSFEMYLPCLAVISRSAFVPSLYALRGAQPVLFTRPFQELKKRTPGPLLPRDQNLDWRQLLRDYDFILLSGKALLPSLPVARLSLVASGPNFRLYEVRK